MKKSTQIILLSFIAVLIVLVLTLGITRAFFKPITDTSSITGVSLSSCAKISLTNTTDAINLSNTYPMSKNRALKTTPYSFTVSSTCDSNVGFNLYIATTTSSTLDASNIHYIITTKGSKDILADGTITEDVTNTFTDAEKTEYNVGMQSNLSKIYKLYNAPIPLKGTSSYDLYLYIDENVTDTSTQGKSFIAGVAVKATDLTLTEYIKGLYTRQGSNNLYYFLNDKSYRYTGANPSNYVCINPNNDGTCYDNSLYRIIGVFDNKVKLVKSSPLSTYSWGDTNDAATSSILNYTLNSYVWSNYIADTNIGSAVLESRWSVKGIGTGDNNYNEEMSFETEITRKVGLLYLNEYYFASSDNWQSNSNVPNFVANKENNWLYLGFNEWTITPYYYIGNYVHYITSEGTINSYGNPSESKAVRPTFYLDSAIKYSGGTGIESDPFILSI